MGLIIWISFIDDMLVVCDKKYMAKIKQEFTGTVDREDRSHPLTAYLTKTA